MSFLSGISASLSSIARIASRSDHTESKSGRGSVCPALRRMSSGVASALKAKSPSASAGRRSRLDTFNMAPTHVCSTAPAWVVGIAYWVGLEPQQPRPEAITHAQ
jgi:hypothetical protein